jgi:hypothetical protein
MKNKTLLKFMQMLPTEFNFFGKMTAKNLELISLQI